MKRLGYKFNGPSTLTKKQAIGIVIKMKSKLGRYTADNRELAQNEIDYLTLVHNITYGDIWVYKKEKTMTETMKKEDLKKGTRIYYTGDMANKEGLGVITHQSHRMYGGTFVTAKMDDGRIFKSLSLLDFSDTYKGTCGSRFTTEEAFEEFNNDSKIGKRIKRKEASMKRITTQKGMRPFISAILRSGKSTKIMNGETIEVEVNGLRYKALWDKEKGLYVEPK